MATPYMNLTLPTVSVTAGPTWATYLNAAFTTVDAHNHTSGSGVPITTAAISINADLDFNSYSATGLTSVVVESQAASIATPLCYYSVAGNPVYNNSGASAGRLVNVSFPLVTGDIIYASSTTAFGRLAIGSSGQVLKVSAGIPSWASPGASLAISDESSASFTASSSVDLYLCSRAGTQAVTLPVTTGGGKQFTFKKTSTAITSIVTITRAGSDVIIDAGSSVTSTTLDTLGEDIVLVDVAAGTWQVINRRIPSIWTSYTPTAGSGFGTVANVSVFYRRSGDSMDIRGTLQAGTVAANVMSITLPTGAAIDSAKITTSTAKQLVGYFTYLESGAGPTTTAWANAFYDGSDTGKIFFGNSTGSNVFNKTNGNAYISNSQYVTFSITVPISGWNG